tara:strand:- start:246 stop:524 length:279 start_codon:yes stop_codon:yes gene_type:complete
MVIILSVIIALIPAAAILYPLIYSKKEKDNLSNVQDLNNIAKGNLERISKGIEIADFDYSIGNLSQKDYIWLKGKYNSEADEIMGSTDDKKK